jgi:hypothetical protein
MIGVVFGLGCYVAKSLNGRLRWYLFCRQERRRHEREEGGHASVS